MRTIAFIALLLAGCATATKDEVWDSMFKWRQDDRVYSDSQITVTYVQNVGGILSLCGPRPNAANVGGCARRESDSCNIVLLADLRGQEYPMQHERRHCKGWNHQ